MGKPSSDHCGLFSAMEEFEDYVNSRYEKENNTKNSIIS